MDRATCARALVWLGVLLSAQVFCASAASAHPLGNFTVNRYSRVEVRTDSIRVRYVLDLAEIPSIQEARAVNPVDWDLYRNRKVDEIGQHLELSLDGRRLDLRPAEATLTRPLGQGDIPLIRLEIWFAAAPSVAVEHGQQHQAIYRDRNDPARLGWREIVVFAGPGVALADSTVPARDVTDELRSYPEDLLQSPRDQREAYWTFGLGSMGVTSGAVPTQAAAGRPTDAFANLITAADLSPTVMLLAIFAAAVLGGMHGASPGHGKSVMAAYIVGTRGTIAHALVLAGSVTLAHTLGVLGLALAVVLASNLIVPEQLYPWLTLASGALVLCVGLSYLGGALRGRADPNHEHHAHHAHADSAQLDHAHSEQERPEQERPKHEHPAHAEHPVRPAHSEHEHPEHQHPQHEHPQQEHPQQERAEHEHPQQERPEHHEHHVHARPGHPEREDPAHEHPEHSEHQQAEPLTHSHSHSHAHPPPANLTVTWKSLFALGLAGGLVPSGSALVVLLSSVALGRLGFGLVLVVAFGLGMALVLVVTGVLIVHAGRLLARVLPEEGSAWQRFVGHRVPLVSATLMTLLGAVATFQGLSQLGVLG